MFVIYAILPDLSPDRTHQGHCASGTLSDDGYAFEEVSWGPYDSLWIVPGTWMEDTD